MKLVYAVSVQRHGNTITRTFTDVLEYNRWVKVAEEDQALGHVSGLKHGIRLEQEK